MLADLQKHRFYMLTSNMTAPTARNEDVIANESALRFADTTNHARSILSTLLEGADVTEDDKAEDEGSGLRREEESLDFLET